jgi:hypothetical protein
MVAVIRKYDQIYKIERVKMIGAGDEENDSLSIHALHYEFVVNRLQFTWNKLG